MSSSRTQAESNGGVACVPGQVDLAVRSGLMAPVHLLSGFVAVKHSTEARESIWLKRGHEGFYVNGNTKA